MPYLVVRQTTTLSAFIPLVSLCITPPIVPTHRNSLDSRLLATNQVDNLGPILCLSHSFYIILHFIVFFKFPVDYLVRCGAISCILCSVPPSCEPLLCAFTLPFICTLSAHPSSSLLQQSLYHIELCLQLHLQSEGVNGCSIILVARREWNRCRILSGGTSIRTGVRYISLHSKR